MPPTGQLRILETTDLHMHLLGHDYFADRSDPTVGLAALSDVIGARRDSAPGACLLCDNGDFLQGTPVADRLAGSRAHPLAQAFNTLGYDAITLGNHEFDFGLGPLASFLAQLDCPVTSTNVTAETGPQPWHSFALCDRLIPCDDGAAHPIRLGILGFAPPSLIAQEDLRVEPIVQAARRAVPALQAAGADLIIALCHCGHSPAGDPPAESANALAQVAGIDVLLLGHAHDIFPQPAHGTSGQLDHVKGTICGKPAVMAGYHGALLGEIDLTLTRAADRWTVTGHHVRLHRNGADQLPRSSARCRIEALARPTHRATRAALSETIGNTGQPLHNAFATVAPDPVAQLFANVMRAAVSQHLGTACDIAAVAPFQPAGTRGKRREIHLPAGPLSRHDAIRLFPFKDRLCAVRRTGAQIRDWLERSAAHYTRLAPSGDIPPLSDPDRPEYLCDALFGLRYRIDLSQPASLPASGPGHRSTHHGRITDLRLGDRPLRDTESYVVATTGFRAGGSGGFPVIPPEDILWRSDGGLQDILITAIAAGAAEALHPETVWQFHALPGSAARVKITGAPQDTGDANLGKLDKAADDSCFIMRF